MTFASELASTYHGCLNNVLIVKVLVGAFNKEKASEGALSVTVIVIANLRCQL